LRWFSQAYSGACCDPNEEAYCGVYCKPYCKPYCDSFARRVAGLIARLMAMIIARIIAWLKQGLLPYGEVYRKSYFEFYCGLILRLFPRRFDKLFLTII